MTFDHIAPGYGQLSAGCVEAISLLARTEAVLLDPVYAGKAMAALMRRRARRKVGRRGPASCSFIPAAHPALFAYGDEISRLPPRGPSGGFCRSLKSMRGVTAFSPHFRPADLSALRSADNLRPSPLLSSAFPPDPTVGSFARAGRADCDCPRRSARSKGETYMAATRVGAFVAAAACDWERALFDSDRPRSGFPRRYDGRGSHPARDAGIDAQRHAVSRRQDLRLHQDLAELVIFDPAHDRFTLLNTQQRRATQVHVDEINRMLQIGRQALADHVKTLRASGKPDAQGMVDAILFQFHPQFEESILQTNRGPLLELKSSYFHYQVLGASPPTPAHGEAYLNYADWIIRLNYVLNPGKTLPEQRIKLDAALRQASSSRWKSRSAIRTQCRCGLGIGFTGTSANGTAS